MSETPTDKAAGLARYRPYPAYRDSGVEWLGEIPVSWEVTRNLGIFEDRREKGFPHLPVYSVTQNEGVIAQEDVAVKIVRPSENRDGYKRIHPGDLVYNKMRMWQGAIGTSPTIAIVSPAYVICRPRKEIETRYFAYLYRTPKFITEFGRYSYGICDDMNSLRFDDFKGIYSIVPPLPEQRSIAAFLDRETGRIDALLAKKERLIELLQEKRTALITRAVTKGLDPDVPMKDSGVEWLGEIPTGWKVMAVKRAALRIQTGTTPPTTEQLYYENGTVPWFGPGSFSDDIEISAPMKYLHESAIADGAARLFAGGSTMIVTIGATIGKVGLITSDASSNQQITAVTPDDRYVHERFLAYQLKRQEPLIRAIVPSTTLPIMDQQEVGYLPVALPLLEEQRAIAAFLDRETAKIDALVEKVRDAIDRLKEYRTALISAAVTGKIDVREEVAA